MFQRSGVISQHRTSTTTPAPYYPPTFPAYASRGRGRGGSSRGGRNTPHLTKQSMSWVKPSLATAESDSAPSSSATATTLIAPASIIPTASTSSFKEGYRNKTLVLNGTRVPVASTSAAGITGSSAPFVPPSATTRNSITGEITIDGVTFVSDPRGNKLVRKLDGSSSLA